VILGWGRAGLCERAGRVRAIEGRLNFRAGLVCGREGLDCSTAGLEVVMGLLAGIAGTGVTLTGTGVGRWDAGTEERGEWLPGISGSGLTSPGPTVSLCLSLLPRDLEFKKFWKPLRRMNGRAVGVSNSSGGVFSSVVSMGELSSVFASSIRRGSEVGAWNRCLEEAVEKEG